VRTRRRGGGPVNELVSAGQEEVVELNVAGLAPEDVPRRPHSDHLTDHVTATMAFVVLEDTDPEATVEVEGELGRDAGEDGGPAVRGGYVRHGGSFGCE